MKLTLSILSALVLLLGSGLPRRFFVRASSDPLQPLSQHQQQEPEDERGIVALDQALRELTNPHTVLCIAARPGVGKTTLAKSIAQAMGRQFVRIPFGGMSDALDLRGQSRVRPDAEIGLVMKGMRFAGTKNPVMLLDEIDRVAEHALASSSGDQFQQQFFLRPRGEREERVHLRSDISM